MGQVGQLLNKHPADVLIARINFMFDGKAKWPPPPYSLDVFVRNIDTWVSQTNSSAEIRQAPSDDYDTPPLFLFKEAK